jgi:hypothetical protein
MAHVDWGNMQGQRTLDHFDGAINASTETTGISE